MGVDVRIVAYAEREADAAEACRAAFDRFAELDDTMSDYRNTSELMRLCAKAGGPPTRVSVDLFHVMEAAIERARRSNGAYDPTCGPVVALWRRARQTRKLPSADEIAQARALTGWQKVRLDRKRRTIRLLVPGMRLDLGAIGKGYGCDCAQEVLKRHGISSALVEAGGDIVVSAPPPGHQGWQIEAPNAGASRPVLSLANCAISSSGDTMQFVEIDGKRYSHVVDARTGMALTSRAAVTVVGPSGICTDGLSTAISILGETQGRALAGTYPGVTVYFRTETGADNR